MDRKNHNRKRADRETADSVTTDIDAESIETESIETEAIETEAIETEAIETEASEAEQSDDRSDLMDDLADDSTQPASDRQGDSSVIDAVESNTQLLQQLLERFDDLRENVNEGKSSSERVRDRVKQSMEEAESERLRDRISGLEDQVDELQQQNSDLASQVASTNVRETVSTKSSGSSDALSWEDRKNLILEQMEEDTFDAESFVASLQEEYADDIESPLEYVEHLCSELERCSSELAKREEELHEYRCLVQSQSETRESGVVIGAAAVAEMVDSDELVQQERERLQDLQAEWEEKFREGEIQASLERAKLSRERQALAKKQAALEEQLEHHRRLTEQVPASESGSSRRWAVKLGLNEKKG